MFQLTLTPEAKKKIEEKKQALKISVMGGGCSGFQYILEWADLAQPLKSEIVYEEDNVTIYTDATSVEFINRSIIDFKEDIIGSRFIIKNPNADVTCGCGRSFA